MKSVQFIKQNAGLKRLVHYLLIPRGQARPRRWVSWFVNPFVHNRHRTSAIRSTARLDVLPFRAFELGIESTIEDYSVLNNGVGDLRIGDFCRIGIGSVVIGPVTIGAHVILAQHVVMSGLNHGYEDINTPIRLQPVTTRPIVVEDECWIGANAVITAGVRIGRHAVVAGGSVVTKDVPPYSIVAGNPARVIKQYDFSQKEWLRVESVRRIPA
ncbi:acyltransferase [Spirosoma pulveris]